jgi:multiple sugar transport system ATP-binding protein
VGEIVIDDMVKEFSGGVRAVDGVSLTVADGEFLVLVGPSGCGKTTLLRLIAGLEEPTKGSIAIAGHDVTDLSPRNRDIAMVFQNYALYPHMTVRENLAYGLKVRRTDKREIAKRVAEVARMLGLEDLLGRKPSALSGGQRQRVAMGRAIVREPAAFLMDEPLSNLDAKLRVSMRAELSRLHNRLGVTTVYVTHDQVEAMTLGERVAVMRDGRIQQLDSPGALYARPANLFVAAFIGSPAMNLVAASASGGRLAFGGFEVETPSTPPPAEGGLAVGIRPEAFEDAAFADVALPRIEIEVSVVEDLGADAHVIFPLDAPRFETGEVRDAVEGESDTLLADDERALFTARVDARTRARPGSTLALAVDPSRFHYFDADSGVRLESQSSELDEGASNRARSAASRFRAPPKHDATHGSCGASLSSNRRRVKEDEP